MHGFLAKLHVAWKQKVEFCSLDEACVSHEVEEDLLAGVPHLHGNGDCGSGAGRGETGESGD